MQYVHDEIVMDAKLAESIQLDVAKQAAAALRNERRALTRLLKRQRHRMKVAAFCTTYGGGPERLADRIPAEPPVVESFDDSEYHQGPWED